jgi:secreted trypsin-like serine protease
MIGCLKALSLIVVGALVSQGNAIIIRHDKNYGDYLIRESQFPSVFFLEKQGSRKVCVATLIHSQWAITAAHCTDQTSLSRTLSDGETFEVLVSSQLKNIDEMVIHPDYISSGNREVDLALLHFTAPLDFPAAVALNTSTSELRQEVTILGWGFFGLGTSGRQYDDGGFRRARNLIESAGQTLSINFDDPRNLNSQVLELEGTIGLGDSGGPALLQTSAGWTLAGVAVGELEGENFLEETQGSYGATAIYERISLHRDWIERTISGEPAQ